MVSLVLTISGGGVLRALYHDDLAGLMALGEATVTRASHVEPAQAGGWLADLGPVGGPVLGPFGLRREALAAEAEWLEQNRL